MSTLPLNPNVQNNLKTLPSMVRSITDQFIVRPPYTGNVIGISGFVFDLVGTEEIMLESDITDHYVEDNTAIQDHIALRPERFVLSGYQGELRDIFQKSFLNILTTVQSFGTVAGLAPSFAAQAAQVYGQIASVASKVANVFDQAQNIYGVFFGVSTTANRQQAAFQYFYNLWQSRQLCQVETPYGILNDMAIERVTAKQDETTRLVSDFSVTFKRFRKASTTSSKNIFTESTELIGRANQVITGSKPVNNGSTSGLTISPLVIDQNFSLLQPTEFES